METIDFNDRMAIEIDALRMASSARQRQADHTTVFDPQRRVTEADLLRAGDRPARRRVRGWVTTAMLAGLLVNAGCAATGTGLGEAPEVAVRVVGPSDFQPDIVNQVAPDQTVGGGAARGAAELGKEAMNDCARSAYDPVTLLVFVPFCGALGAAMGGVAGGVVGGTQGALNTIPEADEALLREANEAVPAPDVLREELVGRLIVHAERRQRSVDPDAGQRLELAVQSMQWRFGVGDRAAIEAEFAVAAGPRDAVPRQRSFTLKTEQKAAEYWHTDDGRAVAAALLDLMDRAAERAWLMIDGEPPAKAAVPEAGAPDARGADAMDLAAN